MNVKLTLIDSCITELATYDRDGHTCYRKDLAPGTGHWLTNHENRPVVLEFVCPCGCGSISGLPVKAGGQGWSWNQSLDRPTCTPSIQKTSPCAWHGYLTDGLFIRC